MKKKNVLFSLALGSFFLILTGCSSYSYTSRSTTINQFTVQSNVPTADIDIDYKHKVTATSDFQKFPNQAKQQALYQCILNNNIDVVVDPIVQVEQRGLSNYRATITGFAGYFKEGKSGIDATVEKNYSKEDVEKYLLLTDPTFYKFYYNKGEGHQYNIKCTNTTSSKPAIVAPVTSTKEQGKKGKVAKQENMSDAYKKAKKMRDTGAALTATGFFMVAGIPLLIKGQKGMKQNQ